LKGAKCEDNVAIFWVEGRAPPLPVVITSLTAKEELYLFEDGESKGRQLLKMLEETREAREAREIRTREAEAAIEEAQARQRIMINAAD
jgi:hypothetical protein